MHKKNQTKRYVRKNLTHADLKYLRRKARKRDSSQLEKMRRLRQAKADHDVVEAKREKDSARNAAKAKANCNHGMITTVPILYHI